MRSWWARIRWADVVVGAIVWCLFADEWMLLAHAFPAHPLDCVESSPFSCWDLRAPMLALLSVPVWYCLWAVFLRPCPWPRRWLTPLAVSLLAFGFEDLAGRGLQGPARVAVLGLGYLASAAVVSAVPDRRR